jgi:hypothetical protein
VDVLGGVFHWFVGQEVKAELWGDAAKALSAYVAFCMTLPDNPKYVSEPGPEVTQPTAEVCFFIFFCNKRPGRADHFSVQGQEQDKKKWSTGQKVEDFLHCLVVFEWFGKKVAVGLGIGAGVLAAGAIGTGIAVAVSKNNEKKKAEAEAAGGKGRSAEDKKDDDEKKDDKKEKKVCLLG